MTTELTMRIKELNTALEESTKDYLSLLDVNAEMEKMLVGIKAENERLKRKLKDAEIFRFMERDECIRRRDDLEAENERLRRAQIGSDHWVNHGIRKGMKLAAEIANTQCTETNECPVWKQIRAELEK